GRTDHSRIARPARHQHRYRPPRQADGRSLHRRAQAGRQDHRRTPPRAEPAWHHPPGVLGSENHVARPVTALVRPDGERRTGSTPATVAASVPRRQPCHAGTRRHWLHAGLRSGKTVARPEHAAPAKRRRARHSTVRASLGGGITHGGDGEPRRTPADLTPAVALSTTA